MLFEIKHRWNGEVLCKVETTSMRLAVEAAIQSKADLRWADLREADLCWANLCKADLRWADLCWANLREADLRWANLRKADLTPIRDDLWAVLSASPREVPGLRQALLDGTVDGSVYEGDGACLIGTLANVKGCKFTALEFVKPNRGRPAERFFLCIGKGETPEKNPAAKLAVAWIDQWLINVRQLVSTPAP